MHVLYVHQAHILLFKIIVVADLDSLLLLFFFFFCRLPFVPDKQSKMGDARGLPHCHDNQAFAEISVIPTLMQDYIWTCRGKRKKKETRKHAEAHKHTCCILYT